MVQDASKLQTLAAAYIRKRQPNARTSDIATAVEVLRKRIHSGELTFDAIVCRLQHAIGNDRASTPASFGDIARACRDLDCGRLTHREHAFVKEMVALGFNRSPSPRQEAWLAAIFARLQRRAA